ncbi:MAG: hypothetical protein IKA64_04900 [Clostridia bacterium]|nr:hypothetical protein [Clostridia bacterium]
MKIRVAVVDGRIPEAARRSLMKEGFRVVTLSPHPGLSPAVASHTDMLICSVRGELIAAAEYCELYPDVFTDLGELLRGWRFGFSADELGEKYPSDCRLNALFMGDCLFARRASLSEYLASRAEAAGYRIVDVAQGYPACTVLKLSESSAVTADRGMARALEKEGVSVTEIECGHISLPPHEYGFIGGAAGVFGGRLYFLGDPKTHPSYEKISAAAEAASLTVVPLCDGPLRDLGGILFAEGDV